MQLARAGHPLALFARDPQRLAEAKQAVLSKHPEAKVEIFSVDVRDRDELNKCIEKAVSQLGAPGLAIASAGIATPGLFLEQPIELHEDHMAINYFGTLNFVHAISGPMRPDGGQIGLLASGAAFFGIYGYGAYAPSKFALRGLAEILHLELEEAGIGITLCYPPDTDTPQLEMEKRTKPKATQRITEGGGLWHPDDVAKVLLDGMNRGQFIVAPGFQMRALNRLTSIVAPLLRWHQRRIIRKETS